MARPRSKDPLGVGDIPNLVSDPVRQAELADEFMRRLVHWRSSYEVWRRVIGGPAEFTSAMRRLQALSNGEVLLPGERLGQLEFEIALDVGARRAARERTGSPTAAPNEKDQIIAAGDFLAKFNRGRGRRENRVLVHHVGALMALIQEFTGLPVTVRREKKDVYDRGFTGGVGRHIQAIFADLDPTVKEATLANIADRLRTQFAGKSMRFVDFMPGYGCLVTPFGADAAVRPE